MIPKLKKLNLLLLVFLLLTLTGIAHAGLFSDSLRYKMTVTVETPEGIKTGSAVREVTVTHGLALMPQMHDIPKVNGEAVVVDLGKRGVLFALMKGATLGEDYGADIPVYALGGRDKKGKAELPPALYPIFVHFKDINDPKTLENVISVSSNGRLGDTGNITQDRMDEIFGKGVSLKRVEIESTDEPITHLIKKYHIPRADKGLYAIPHNLIPLSDFQKGD